VIAFRALFVSVVCAAFLGTAFGRSGASQEVVVDLSCEPAEAEIGQPVTWTLVVEHPRGGDVTLQGAEEPFAEDAENDRLWVELATRRRTIVELGGERTRTTYAWTVCALDAGSHTLEGLRVEVDLPDRLVSKAAEGATLFVRGALGDGEDVPRPLAGFRPAPPSARGGAFRRVLPALLLVFALAVALLVRRRRLRRGPALLQERVGSLVELGALSESLNDEPGVGAELGYALSHLLRREVDTVADELRAPLTDAEWAASIEADSQLPEPLRFGLARLVRDLEPLKYGGSNPTRFALQEFLERARGHLEELDRMAPDSATTATGAGMAGATPAGTTKARGAA